MPEDASLGACPFFNPARAAWKPSNCAPQDTVHVSMQSCSHIMFQVVAIHI